MYGLQVEKLQIIQPQLVLFSKDVPYQSLMWKSPSFWLMSYWLIKIEELAYYGPIADVFGTVQKPSYFGIGMR